MVRDAGKGLHARVCLGCEHIAMAMVELYQSHSHASSRYH